MKTNPLRVLCLVTLATGSVAASGSLFARDFDYRGEYRSEARFERHEDRGRDHWRYDHYDRRYGPRHEVIVSHYRPRVITREVIVERQAYYAPAPVAYTPSIGQVVGGIIGGVIDSNR
jgi:hypothetical protein